MSYKIAIASSDCIQIDETFGSAQVFRIYEVTDENYSRIEDRNVSAAAETISAGAEASGVQQECGSGNGCGSGRCHTDTGGCGGSGGVSPKVELISDCRCVVCRKIGFHIQKQLERRAITSFDVSCSVEEALKKITLYFRRIDGHQSLRGISNTVTNR